MQRKNPWGLKFAMLSSAAVFIALGVACSGAGNSHTAAAGAGNNPKFNVVATPQPRGETVTQEKPAVGHLDARLQDYVDEARKHLASHLGVVESEIETLQARYVTWRDSSLGCPQPDMAYTQSLVDGTQIKLRHAGKTYHYHGGRNRQPRLCEMAAPNEPLPYRSGDA